MNEEIGIHEFIEKCKTGGIDEAKKLLRKFVLDDQPNSFCSGYSTRAMCREASNAITGEEFDYINTKHGLDLYFHMWGGGDL